MKNPDLTIAFFDVIQGKYQNNFLVYNKVGEYFKINNKKAKIVRKIQSGRATYYCPYLQK